MNKAFDENIWQPKTATIPDTWAHVDFLSAFDPISVNKKKVPAKSYLTDGKLPIVDQGQQFIGGYTDDLSLEIDPGEGLIVFGDHTRVFKRIAFPFAAGADGIKVLRPVLSDFKYAHYACLSLQFPNRGYSRHYSYLSKCKFPVAPRHEQERIVSKIDELFSGIEEGERALEKAHKLVGRYRRSVLKAAVTGGLTREWREKHKGKLESGEALLARILKGRRETWEQSELDRMNAKGEDPTNQKWKGKYKEPLPPDASELPELPKGWIWATVEQLSTKVVDGVHKKPNYVPDGIPFVTVKNLTAGPGISFENLQYITAEDHIEFTKRTNPERDDVLVSKDGTLGVTRLVNNDVDFSIFVSVALVKPVFRNMGAYLELALSSPVVQAQMVPKGSGLQHIHLEDLRRDCVPLCSIEEQQVLIDAVAVQSALIDRIETDLTDYLAEARRLRQSVLRNAFAGMLISHDPSDEPASILLERIAAERNKPKKEFAPIHRRKKKATV